jgi:hypothetical protein
LSSCICNNSQFTLHPWSDSSAVQLRLRWSTIISSSNTERMFNKHIKNIHLEKFVGVITTRYNSTIRSSKYSVIFNQD